MLQVISEDLKKKTSTLENLVKELDIEMWPFNRGPIKCSILSVDLDTVYYKKTNLIRFHFIFVDKHDRQFKSESKFLVNKYLFDKVEKLDSDSLKFVYNKEIGFNELVEKDAGELVLENI